MLIANPTCSTMTKAENRLISSGWQGIYSGDLLLIMTHVSSSKVYPEHLPHFSPIMSHALQQHLQVSFFFLFVYNLCLAIAGLLIVQGGHLYLRADAHLWAGFFVLLFFS